MVKSPISRHSTTFRDDKLPAARGHQDVGSASSEIRKSGIGSPSNTHRLFDFVHIRHVSALVCGEHEVDSMDTSEVENLQKAGQSLGDHLPLHKDDAPVKNLQNMIN